MLGVSVTGSASSGPKDGGPMVVSSPSLVGLGTGVTTSSVVTEGFFVGVVVGSDGMPLVEGDVSLGTGTDGIVVIMGLGEGGLLFAVGKKMPPIMGVGCPGPPSGLGSSLAVGRNN